MSLDRQYLPVPAPANPPPPLFTQGDDDESSSGISLAQILCIVRAFWKHSVLIALALILTFAFLIKILPKSYVATATLIVNRGNKDPLASPDFPAGWENTFIPTQIDLIQSPAVLQPVIDQLHLTTDREFTRGFAGSPAEVREIVFTNLRNSLAVYQGNGSDLLYISATSRLPGRAATLANAVATEYLTLNRQRTDEPATQRAELYSRELSQLREATIAAQNKVTAFRQQHGMVDLSPSKSDEAESALTDLQQKLLAAQNEKRDLEAQLQARSPEGGSGEAATTSLAKTLDQEQAELARLRATLGSRHPTVVALESQIAATKRLITANASARLGNAEKLVQKYQAAVDAQRQMVLQRRRIQDEGTKLLLELQSAQATYKHALDGYSSIEFASSNSVTDVTLVSRAAPPARSVKPNKMKYFLASCMMSLMLALALPFAYELFLNRRLRCRDDLERHFGIPVLAQFGPMSERAAR